MIEGSRLVLPFSSQSLMIQAVKGKELSCFLFGWKWTQFDGLALLFEWGIVFLGEGRFSKVVLP